MRSRFLITLCSLLIWVGHNFAQEIYPTVQTIVKTEEQLSYNGVQIKGKINHNIQGVLSAFVKKEGLPVIFKKSKKLSHEEGYTLTISKKKIQITYKTDRGAFYAAQTLRQLLIKAKRTSELPIMTIQDFPDIAHRGVVEGFYGEPWSFEDRIAQLKFYGRWKLNTYIYGPKDDPYHSSPNWREAYPDQESNKLQKLVSTAKANAVDFYWAIHPGKDIKWNRSDSLAVLHKFELMYALGVRHFAVFFDDISGVGAKAEKQAGLLNYLQKAFVDKKPGVGPLIMCPTEYNKLWSDPKPNTYLDILGNKLDKRIQIMWTGNSVIHDITKEGQQWVNQKIKRPSFVWWNFPVSDYVRNHLLLGPVYGLDQNIKTDVSGFVSNPMDKAEASKVAIFSVADYAWNMKDYNPHKTWKQAIHEIMPAVERSYAIFSKNNTDPGPSYHKYRRIESEDIGHLIDSLAEVTIDINTFPVSVNHHNLSLIKAACAEFAPAALDIINHAKNKNLVLEIKPWLLHFASLGQASLSLINLLESNDIQQAYTAFLALQNAHNTMVDIDKNNNRNPYQPGIVTGSRHILPWVEKSYFHFAALFREKGYPVPRAHDQASGKVLTSLTALSGLPVVAGVIIENKPLRTLKFSPLLEVVNFKPGDYIGIEITTNQLIKAFKYTLLPANKGMQVQYSENNQQWFTKQSKKATAVRIYNQTDQTIQFKLQDFTIILQ